MSVPIDLRHQWSAVEIAAAATFLAAIVAAVASFVVAAINGWSARRLRQRHEITDSFDYNLPGWIV